MKFLFDLFPLILFFVGFKWAEGHVETARQLIGALGIGIQPEQAPVMLATLVAIVATFVQVGYLLARRRKVDNMLWFSLVVIVVMGGLTLYLHDDRFIKLKPTILFGGIGVLMLILQAGFNRNLLRKGLEEQIQLPDAVWNRLSYAYIVFLIGLAALNLFLAFVLFADNTPAWVNFKVFGLPGLLFAFAIGQSFFLAKYIQEDA